MCKSHLHLSPVYENGTIICDTTEKIKEPNMCISLSGELFIKMSLSLYILPLGRPICYWQCHFFKHVATWISLNPSVCEGSFCIVCFTFWIIVISFIFTVNSNPCGLPPECNIRCYVLDVSMPKHTMHCTPDLVTVLPPSTHWFHLWVTWLCCRLVDLRPCHPLMTFAYLKDLFVGNECAWLTGRQSVQNQIHEKRNTKKNSCILIFRCTVAILSLFSVCCYIIVAFS